jgi:hypothetical protein
MSVLALSTVKSALTAGSKGSRASEEMAMGSPVIDAVGRSTLAWDAFAAPRPHI